MNFVLGFPCILRKLDLVLVVVDRFFKMAYLSSAVRLQMLYTLHNCSCEGSFVYMVSLGPLFLIETLGSLATFRSQSGRK